MENSDDLISRRNSCLLHTDGVKIFYIRADFTQSTCFKRYKSSIHQISIFTYCCIGNEFIHIFPHSRNDTDMSFFRIKEERSGYWVFIGFDIIKADLYAVNGRTLNLITVLVKKTESENPKILRVSSKALYNKRVILSSLFDGIIFPELITLFLTQLIILPGFFTTSFHDQTVPCVSGSRSRRWRHNSDGHVR